MSILLIVSASLLALSLPAAAVGSSSGAEASTGGRASSVPGENAGSSGPVRQGQRNGFAAPGRPCFAGPVWRAELHCHTTASDDGFNSFLDLLLECKRKDINLVALTDHDRIGFQEWGRRLLADNGITAVSGCEMTTATGVHILGLFVNEPVSGRPTLETVREITARGGVVGIPHPLKPEVGLLAVEPARVCEQILGMTDFIELYNGDWDAIGDRQRILDYARTYDLTLTVGSDAHRLWEIGRLVTELPRRGNEVTPEVFRRAKTTLVRLGSPTGRETPVSGDGASSGTGGGWLKQVIRAVRHNGWYREAIQWVPFGLKRAVRECLYIRPYWKHRQAPPPVCWSKLPREGEAL